MARHQSRRTASPTASTPITRALRDPSPRARGQAGGDATQGQTYRVVRGDTLSGIAARVAERPATIRRDRGCDFRCQPGSLHSRQPRPTQGRALDHDSGDGAVGGRSHCRFDEAPLPAVREAELPRHICADRGSAPVADERSAAAARRRCSEHRRSRCIETLPRPQGTSSRARRPVPAATRTDLATDAPSPATTARAPPWLTACSPSALQSCCGRLWHSCADASSKPRLKLTASAARLRRAPAPTGRSRRRHRRGRKSTAARVRGRHDGSFAAR